MKEKTMEELKAELDARRSADREWYLSLLDNERQLAYENGHLQAVLKMLKICYVARHVNAIRQLKSECDEIKSRRDYGAEDCRALIAKHAEIDSERKKLNAYQRFFSEPYFARMDVTDEKEGYNSYYIGKKGDVNLAIVDWRAPLAVRYYQKSRVRFSINEYDYSTVLRRSLLVKSGKLVDFKNEYLSVNEVLTPEEIAGRDEEILFDPYLRGILESRKGDSAIRDIIRTIQEKQFEIINLPERESFVLQGCAGSGKTMILLHRLSYLMYNNEQLRPRDVLVITPSDSFNDFIDELSKTLELSKVMTVTLQSYYDRILKNEGLDLKSKMKADASKESEAYLSYLYSERFTTDARCKIKKLFDGVYGFFTGEECRALATQIERDFASRERRYTKIKNASQRVRRAVLGEIRELKDGGFGFTKPFRALMSAYVDAREFLHYALNETPRSPDEFFRRFIAFYRCAALISSASERVFAQAQDDLSSLTATVEGEIADYRRYRIKRGDEEVYTYAERIARRQELLGEIGKIKDEVASMSEGVALFCDFFSVIRLSDVCMGLGKCENAADVARWLYRETVREYKKKYALNGLYPSDAYAVCRILQLAGRRLTPRYGYVFVDEGQDISRQEYELLRLVNSDAAFNVFGDLRQNVTPWRTVGDWQGICDKVYLLEKNYRNTNEIVGFVTERLGVEMTPIGLHGKQVERRSLRKLAAFFREKQGLKAVICREEYLPLFCKRAYHILRDKGKLSRTRVNVMTVYESKGLEFSAVAVYDRDMTDNERYIAYTRALSELTLVTDE